MDWLDPEAWKRSAELVGGWPTVGSAAVAFGALLGLATERGHALATHAVSRVRAHLPRRDTLTIVQNERFSSRWNHAKHGQQDGTHVHGIFNVLNGSENNVIILKARLRPFDTDCAVVMTLHPEKEVFREGYPVLPNRMSQVLVDFTFFPAIASGEEPLITDVIFTDNSGGEHRVRDARFRYIEPAKSV